jgi:hypothetical protein
MSLPTIFSRFCTFGFSGSRSSVPSGAAYRVARLVPASASVFVGCAPGVDEFFRSSFPSATVLQASSFGSGPGAFAARSVAVVRAVAAANGLWVSFPCSPCPSGLLPSCFSSKAFCGSGSGSWASLAFALGSGVPSLVFLGCSLPCPRGWGLIPVAGWSGWFGCSVACGVRPAHTQLSLL